MPFSCTLAVVLALTNMLAWMWYGHHIIDYGLGLSILLFFLPFLVADTWRLLYELLFLLLFLPFARLASALRAQIRQ